MTQVMWTDEQLSAFLDGELPAADMDALALQLETDAELASRMERIGSANTAYVAAVSEIDTRPMKDSLKAALEAPPQATVIPFKRKSIGAFVMEHRAIAASLLCAAGVFALTSNMSGSSVGDPLAPGEGGMILASSPLHQMLEASATGEGVALAGGTMATPRLTFASVEGDFCRQFDLTSASGASAAIACREDGGWRTQIVAYGLKRTTGDYQTASAERSPALEAFLDQQMDGAPVNAEEEAKLLSGGWEAGRP